MIATQGTKTVVDKLKGKDIPNQPFKGTTVPLPKWLDPITQGKETFTPTIGTLYSLTGIPYLKEELKKIEAPKEKSVLEKSKSTVKALEPYGQSVVGLNTVNLMAETFGLKGTE